MCSYARKTAPSAEAIDGNTLISEDGNVVTELLLTGQTFSKVDIDIDIDNCKIEIHGNAETSSVKLVNFNENTYIAAAGEKVLTVSNKITILDYFNLDGTGVAFSGVWKTLRSFFQYDTEGKEREVHVYIGKDAEVSQVSVNISNNTTLLLADIAKDCDITLKAADSKAELSSINAASMSISGSNSEISLANSSFTNLEYTAKDTTLITSTVRAENIVLDSEASTISLMSTDFRNMDAVLGTSEFSMSTKYDRTSFYRKIEISEGVIIENLTDIGQKDESPEYLAGTTSGHMNISVKSGSISIIFGTEILAPILPENPSQPTA